MKIPYDMTLDQIAKYNNADPVEVVDQIKEIHRKGEIVAIMNPAAEDLRWRLK